MNPLPNDSPAPSAPCDVIWAWERAPKDALRQRAHRARTHGIVRAAVALSVAALAAWLGWWVVTVVAGAIGGLTLVLALLSPLGGYRRLAGAIEAAAAFVGHAVGWLTLAPLYFLVFTPMGLVMRRRARDPLQRELDSGRVSYWVRRRAPRPDQREHLF